MTVEEFETSALDRLRILAEIESSAARNRSWDETKQVTMTQCGKYLPLNSNSALGIDVLEERRKDRLGHFVLRLAFCRSCVIERYPFQYFSDKDLSREELRRRFIRAETTLFRIRFETDDSNERRAFLDSKDFNWISVCILVSLAIYGTHWTYVIRSVRRRKNGIRSN